MSDDDKKSRKIEKSIEEPFFGSQEAPAFQPSKNGPKTGKPRPKSDDSCIC